MFAIPVPVTNAIGILVYFIRSLFFCVWFSDIQWYPHSMSAHSVCTEWDGPCLLPPGRGLQGPVVDLCRKTWDVGR